jgi:hypothetical protein
MAISMAHQVVLIFSEFLNLSLACFLFLGSPQLVFAQGIVDNLLLSLHLVNDKALDALSDLFN